MKNTSYEFTANGKSFKLCLINPGNPIPWVVLEELKEGTWMNCGHAEFHTWDEILLQASDIQFRVDGYRGSKSDVQPYYEMLTALFS